MAKPSRHEKRRKREAAQSQAASVTTTTRVMPSASGDGARVRKEFVLVVDILDAWHPGSGRGLGLRYDAVARRDESGFPFLSGRHLRGLLRAAVQCLHAWGHVNDSQAESRLFGPRRGVGAGPAPPSRALDLSMAELPTADRQALLSAGAVGSLFLPRYQIAMDPELGVTRPRSLRSIEIVAPCTLVAPLTLSSMSAPQSALDAGILAKAAALVHAVGGHRNRGLGRARLSLERLP